MTPGSDFLPFSAKTGEGMPHRAIISSRPSGWFRQSEHNSPGIFRTAVADCPSGRAWRGPIRGLPFQLVGIQLLSSKSRANAGQARRSGKVRLKRQRRADERPRSEGRRSPCLRVHCSEPEGSGPSNRGCCSAKHRHQGVPAVLAFFERHGVGACDGGGGRFNIVGVDDQGAF